MSFHSALLLMAFLTLIANGVAWTSAFQPSTTIPFARRMRNLRSPTLLPVAQQYPHPEKCASEMTCVDGRLLDMHMPATSSSNGIRHCLLIRFLPCRLYVCIYACMYRMSACTYVCIYACVYVCIHVSMYVCTYVCMYVCICVYIRAFMYESTRMHIMHTCIYVHDCIHGICVCVCVSCVCV